MIAGWHGWLWIAGQWEHVCAGDTMETCCRLLGEEGRRLGVPAPLRVMTGGAAPRFVPSGGMARGRAGAAPSRE